MKAMTSLFRTSSSPLHKPLLPHPSLPRRSSSISLILNTYHSPLSRSFSESDLTPSSPQFHHIGIHSSSPLTEIEFCDVGGNGRHDDIPTVTGGNGGDRLRIGAYYEEMIQSNPSDALLLGNYAKFLHEVEGDAVRAEEYYGRAMLANPGDGELLSLYGRLVWETHRDESRAQSYFHHAMHASPNDCSILGSYAHFMWEAEDEEEVEEDGDGENRIMKELTAALAN